MMSRFSAEVREAIVGHVRAGVSLADAAAAADVAAQTLKNWLSRGRAETDTDHARFAAAVDAAREAAAAAAMTDHEFQGHLNAAVRRGSVTAMRLWVQVNREPPDDDDPFELDELDRLKERRDTRLGVVSER